MEWLRSECATSVDIGPSNAQPPSATTAARTSTALRHTPGGWVERRLTRPDGIAMQGRSASIGERVVIRPRLSGQGEERLQQDVGAALDGGGIAGLVHAVALAAPGGDEEHAGLRDQRQVLGVVAGRRVERLPAEAELLAGRLH